MASAAELAQLAIGKPFFLGDNILRLTASTPVWNAAGTLAGGDITEDGFPGYRAYDEHAGMYTMPDATITAMAEIFLLFDLSAAAAAGLEFDTLVADLDLRDCGADTTIRAQIDTDPAFSAPQNITSADTWVGAGAGNNIGNFKWVKPHLTADAVFTNQGYLRIQIRRDAGTTNFAGAPKIGEIYLGMRRQLSVLPQIPHDDQRRESTVADFIAYSGRRHRIVRARGAQPFPVSFAFGNDPGLAGVDDLAALRAWYADIDEGVRPFYYCDEPLESPARALFLDLPDPALDIPRTSFGLRQFSMNAREMPPYRTLEIAE